MFRFLIIFTLFFGSCSLFSQEQQYFAGTIKLRDINIYPYQIVFEEDRGAISGYSVTDAGGKYETKSLIKGSIDRINKTIQFTEFELVHAKDLDFKDQFCFVNFSGNLVDVGAKKHIQGRFNNLFENGEEYIFGLIKIIKTDPPPPEPEEEITEPIAEVKTQPEPQEVIKNISSASVATNEVSISSESKMQALAKPLPKPKPPQEAIKNISSASVAASEVSLSSESKMQALAKPLPKPKIVKEDMVQKKEKAEPLAVQPTAVVKKGNVSKLNSLRKKETLEFTCTEETISMLIYDEDREDDDMIDLYIDGQPVLISYRVTRRAKKVDFKMIDNRVEVQIKALNNGIIGRNSVRFDIVDGKNLLRTTSSLTTDETATLVFVKE